ncbi:hypothetical protein AA12717_3725 [Gluconacetobacter sacchari DSM 12717]|uniref:Uncharacterized protein n=2 Tax=Gluconacetobacter sacchari TaxID=92759 RepID=A0A7W4I9W5_9PROT|nr:hypothetical protein [Gluconacetobacter sacchari]MBB2158961.1 hypothetical protein [Gluconacetobacter sacchari]GBQ31318.1 hypothetical protein AA12717_3725 [Gluconacetobacter sacchari DSM 12717]
MGPEELSIIMSPQFINATFRAGEDWYNNLMERKRAVEQQAQEAARQNQLHALRAANANLWQFNSDLLRELSNKRLENREQSAALSVAERDLFLANAANAGLSSRLEQVTSPPKPVGAVPDLATFTSDLQASVQRAIANEQKRKADEAASAAMASERRSQERILAQAQAQAQELAQVRAERDEAKTGLEAARADGYRLQSEVDLATSALKTKDILVTALEAERRDNALAAQAIEAAGMTVMYVTAQAMEAWAAQGKAPMLDNLMTSHTKAGGRPMTMREYLWFATLIKEMKARDVPDHLIRARCPVDGIEDFLAREVVVSDRKVALTLP